MLRIAKSLLTIVAVATIAAGATSAAWTDSVTVTDNSFTTGFMDITVAPASMLYTAANIYPGWDEDQSIVVTNSGSVPLNYNIAIAQTAGDADLFPSPDFLLTIGTTLGGSELYSGTVSGFAGLSSVRNLAPAANETLYFNVSLSGAAGNGLQNKAATFSITFNATQP